MGKPRKRKSRLSPVVNVDGDKTTIDTGICRRTIRYVEPKTHARVEVRTASGKSATFSATLAKSEAELRADGEAWNAEPARSISLVREQAVHFFKPHAVEVANMAKPPLMTAMHRHDLGDGLRTYQLSEDAPPIARDAGEVLSALYLVETTDEPRYKILRAFQLGRLYERMLIRQLEHRAIAGLNQERRARQIGEKRRAKAEPKRQARRSAIQRELNRQSQSGVALDYEAAYRAVAKKRGESVSTVKQAWLNVP
jgi:hypothetical protein